MASVGDAFSQIWALGGPRKTGRSVLTAQVIDTTPLKRYTALCTHHQDTRQGFRYASIALVRNSD